MNEVNIINEIHGRKIDLKYESIIDRILLNINDYMNPIYKKLHFTPNILTTLSLVITLIGLYIYTKNYIILGAILYFIGYYFDCADGNFARKYNLQTQFGDYYDHGSDLFKIIILIYVFYNLEIKVKTKQIIFSMFIILGILSNVHLGCQEHIYNKPEESSSLSLLKKLCYNPDYIVYTRFFGPGTSHFFIMIVLIFAKQFNNIIN